jgi:hypothetical protein
MQKYLKAFYASALAALGATSAAYVQGNGHIGWGSGITIAIVALSSLGVIWGVPNASELVMSELGWAGVRAHIDVEVAMDDDADTNAEEIVLTEAGTTTARQPSTDDYHGGAGIGVVLEGGNLDIVSTPNIYAQVVGGAWSSDVGSVISKVAGLGLVYFDGTDVKQNYSTGVPYTQASANGWLLKDSAGNLLVNTQYSSYCADIGAAAYQSAWVSNVKSYLDGHPGVDGIFIDNVLYDPKADCGAYPAKYPTTASWDTAMVSFVKAVYAGLHPLGYYIETNTGAFKSGDTAYNDGTSTVAWWKQVGPYADGLMNEFYDETSDGTLRLRTTGTAWYQSFDGWQRLIGTAQNMGDDFAGLFKTAGMNTAAATYGKASFLLEWSGGGGAFDYSCGNSCDPTNGSWTANIGVPKGTKFAVGVGYERSYTAGTVLVNPSPTASQTFTVNGTSYTLAPTTARILTS